MNENTLILLKKLATKALIDIKNQFLGFVAAPEITVWHLEAEHCSYRGNFYKGKAEIDDLNNLITEALVEMEAIERRYGIR